MAKALHDLDAMHSPAPRARRASPARLRRSVERFPFATLFVHLAIAFAGAYGLYLVLVHVLILTPLLPSLIATEDLDVQWTRAWSLWPGPILHVLDVKDVLPPWTRGLLVLDGLDAKAKLRWTNDGVSIRDFDAEAGLYELWGHLSTKGDALDAELGITYGLFGVMVETRDGKSTVSPIVE